MPLQMISMVQQRRIFAFWGGRARQVDVIYLDGFIRLGLGASTVLKAVVERLRSSSSDGAASRKAAGLDKNKIIHIDCSLWQSKRSLQKAIAMELKLPQEVMAFFDQVDDEDDFDGVQPAARGVISRVKLAILNELSNCKFLVVFHNGSGNYVDLWECGVPVMGDMSKRVLWTSMGRFLLHGIQDENSKKLAGLSDVSISVAPHNYCFADDDHIYGIVRRFLHADAKEIARYSSVPEHDTKIVLECILYKVLTEDYGIDWGIHAANYWVCDGIIQDANHCGRSAWEIGYALHRTMNLVGWDAKTVSYIRKVLCHKQWKHSDRWVSGTGQDTAAVQAPMTSFFWTAAIIEGGVFKEVYRSSLRVLHLSNCTFCFSSPPFLSCSNLRFLLLNHCKDKNNNVADRGGEQGRSQMSDGACFLKLWVLELSYTDWYWLLSEKMFDLMAELRELSVKGPGNWSLSHLHGCSGVGKNTRRLLKLRVVGELKDNDDDIGSSCGHRNQQASSSSFPDLSSWHNLKTITLDGCAELEEIGCNTLPSSLESFSFTSDIATKIKRISFRGCARVKSLLLTGLFHDLKELDMSGTSIKTIDLSETQALGLRRLILLGCEKLRAILWPKEQGRKIYLEVLRIDTTCAGWDREDKSNKQKATRNLDCDTASVDSSAGAVHGNNQALTNLHSYISLRDTRLFRSLLRVRFFDLHVVISSVGCGKKDATQGLARNCEQELQKAADNLYGDDIISTFQYNWQTAGDNGDVADSPAIKWMWACPPTPMNHNWARCYISIQETSTTLPGFVHKDANTLHLHDSSITCIPGPTPAATLRWRKLQWCRVERCPNLEGSVFTAPSFKENGDDIFGYLETFWASQLLKARYIWDWSTSVFRRPGKYSFANLLFLHLDYCPRLVHVLPLYTSNVFGCHRLETLEIICCGELREVFPTDLESQQQEPGKFRYLKRIHLYELPKLQRICRQGMFAPKLETVKIRGCWNLKRMPAVRRPPRRRILDKAESSDSIELDEEDTRLEPTVDCEKEWWDGLEWDGEEAGHHPSHYKPIHSAYYKKTLRRASVLR